MSVRLLVAALALFTSVSTLAADLKVLSSSALNGAWGRVKPVFEARGHRLDITLQPSGRITKRVEDGEAADLVVTSQEGLEALKKGTRLVAGTGRDIATSATGVAVRKGAPRPDISTPAALRQALLSARVAYTDAAGGGASGAVFAKVLKDLGIEEAVRARGTLGSGIPNGAAILRGEADLAVQQIPELVRVDGIEIVGPLPAPFESLTVFSGAVLAASRQPEVAKALLDFLVSPEGAALFRASGFQ